MDKALEDLCDQLEHGYFEQYGDSDFAMNPGHVIAIGIHNIEATESFFKFDETKFCTITKKDVTEMQENIEIAKAIRLNNTYYNISVVYAFFKLVLSALDIPNITIFNDPTRIDSVLKGRFKRFVFYIAPYVPEDSESERELKKAKVLVMPVFKRKISLLQC